MNGWIVLDKPAGITSAGALNKIKRELPKGIKIGHAGTLDPFATGMLLVAIGEATKLSDHAMNGSKDYEFDITFGKTTDTLDLDGTVVSESGGRPTISDLREVIMQFEGGYEQMPPDYSALKINGQRAYKLARAGEVVALSPRSVQLDSINLISFDGNVARLRICCGKGFYVRSLARDICKKLSVDGHVTHLRRTRVGKFLESDMISLVSLLEIVHNPAMSFLHQPHLVLDDILVVSCDDEVAKAMKFGKTVPNFTDKKGVLFLTNNNKLVAIVNAGHLLEPKRVFNL